MSRSFSLFVSLLLVVFAGACATAPETQPATETESAPEDQPAAEDGVGLEAEAEDSCVSDCVNRNAMRAVDTERARKPG